MKLGRAPATSITVSAPLSRATVSSECWWAIRCARRAGKVAPRHPDACRSGTPDRREAVMRHQTTAQSSRGCAIPSGGGGRAGAGGGGRGGRLGGGKKNPRKGGRGPGKTPPPPPPTRG